MTRFRPAAMVPLITALLCWPGAHSAWAESTGAVPKKSDDAACQRAAFRVIVDVGHTAEAPGAKSSRGIYEYVFNLILAKRIHQQLVDAGFGRTVLLITDGPPRPGLAQRVARANSMSADLFLSIHHDSVPDKFIEKWEFENEERSFSDRFKGHSIFVSNQSGDPKGSLQFARLLGQQLKARDLKYTPHYTEKFMGSRQRLLVDAGAGVYRYDQLIVLKNTHMPAVLLEAGSIINRDEELLVSSPERQAATSDAVTAAVEEFCAAGKSRSPEPAARRPASGTDAKALRPAAAPAKQR
jgi:N-acetylmuramoyl-L-alanine amidase